MDYAYFRVNTHNIKKNYDCITNIVGSNIKVAAVVKSNGYGLGGSQVGLALAHHGCNEFYVATVEEGIELRKAINQTTKDIFILNGVTCDTSKDLFKYNLTPVINSEEQLRNYEQLAARTWHTGKLPISLHVDTGMHRIGIDYNDFDKAITYCQSSDAYDIKYIMSHLACADDIKSEMNKTQLNKLKKIQQQYPQYLYSFANSAGILLGKEYFFDQVRAGILLYGCNPIENKKSNHVLPVASLHTKILQIYSITDSCSVGYKASHELTPGMVIATIPIGYGDGYPRALSNKGYCCIAGIKVPIIGKISMDLMSVDISNIPKEMMVVGQDVEVIGADILVENIANMSNTISYEILTSLGNFIDKKYI